MVASLPEIWPKLHESEIEPINIDINSALDWGYWWIPSRHSWPRPVIEKCRTEMTPILSGEEEEEDVLCVRRKKSLCMTGDD